MTSTFYPNPACVWGDTPVVDCLTVGPYSIRAREKSHYLLVDDIYKDGVPLEYFCHSFKIKLDLPNFVTIFFFDEKKQVIREEVYNEISLNVPSFQILINNTTRSCLIHGKSVPCTSFEIEAGVGKVMTISVTSLLRTC